jgi:leucyl/phenylalanyl-tRNA--protein transferase
VRPDPRILLGALLEAYAAGYFPMADPATGRVGWFSPHPRAVLPLDGFHVSRSLARTLRRRRFIITADMAFDAVTRECARPRTATAGNGETWINDEILRYYSLLHGTGYAHSIEAWRPPNHGPSEDGELVLVGGIYGVAIGAAFIAESMFCRPERGGTDASKVCLAHLVGHLRARGFTLLDVQIANPHTRSLGAVEVGRAAFRRDLARAAARPIDWRPFDAAAASATVLNATQGKALSDPR